jgi:predicted metal-dependent peptidase
MQPVVKKVAARAILRGTMDHVVESMVAAVAAYAIELNKLSETDPNVYRLVLEQIEEMEKEERKEKKERRRKSGTAA